MLTPEQITPIEAFAERHKELLGLFTMASIVTMRKTLPWPFSRVAVLEWSYEWLRDALLTLLSLKGPLPHEAVSQTSEHIASGPDGRIESTKETTVSAPVPAVPEKP